MIEISGLVQSKVFFNDVRLHSVKLFLNQRQNIKQFWSVIKMLFGTIYITYTSTEKTGLFNSDFVEVRFETV